MSSRNRYLNDAQRKIAVKLYEALCLVKNLIAQNPDYKMACQTAKCFLLDNGFNKIDYIEVRCGETLSPPPINGHIRILGAAFLGTTRLIDNIKTETL
jgi:pantoate--beta-alanine ligase